jgi:hypothetical protein
MELTATERERIVEIAYYEIYQHLRRKVPSDKLFVYLENFCRVFEVDYTNVRLATVRYMHRLAPTKYEKSMFAIVTGLKLKDMGLDYRTIRSHKEYFTTHEFELYPNITNKYMLEDLRKFVRSYFNLFVNDALYLYNYYEGGGFNEETET